MKLNWQALPRPIIALAPVAGYSDSPFRRIVKELNPSVLCFTEFISSDGLSFGGKLAARRLHFTDIEQPLVVQLFGCRAKYFREAALLAEAEGAAAIDINMGCPARQVVGSGSGSSLRRDTELACQIVREVRRAVSLPVSVKTRLGWTSDSNLIEFVKHLEDAGISAITVHGRTVQQKFSGPASWETIYQLKRKVSIPVIGNGDIKSHADIQKKLQNLDGVMIARAAFGNPWIFTPLDQTLDLSQKIPTIIRHVRYAIEVKGEQIAMREMRKHLAAYIKNFPQASKIRCRLMQVSTLSEVVDILSQINKKKTLFPQGERVPS